MEWSYLAVLFQVSTAAGGGLQVEMKALSDQGVGAPIGSVQVTTTPHGLLLTPALKGLPPGLHGFHLHEKPSCAPAEKEGQMRAGLAAGPHLDPQGSGRHEGPYGEGHGGDLPALYVDAAGNALTPVLAPRLKPEDLRGRSLMIHAGGDNYADKPEPLGGGGARIACGVVP